jgi:hypothetical protein
MTASTSREGWWRSVCWSEAHQSSSPREKHQGRHSHTRPWARKTEFPKPNRTSRTDRFRFLVRFLFLSTRNTRVPNWNSRTEPKYPNLHNPIYIYTHTHILVIYYIQSCTILLVLLYKTFQEKVMLWRCLWTVVCAYVEPWWTPIEAYR